MTDREKPPPNGPAQGLPAAALREEEAALMAMAEKIMQKRRKVLRALAQ